MIKPTLKTKGQSLFEVVIALAVLSIILMGLIRTVIISLKNVEYSANKNLALNLAQSAIESLRKERDETNWEVFWTKYNLPGDDTEVALIAVHDKFDREGNMDINGLFERTGTVKNVSSPFSDVNKMEITIYVDWSDSLRNHQVSVSGYLAKWN